MIKQFNFYKSYGEIVVGLNNTEAGQYIKRLCEFMFRDKEFDVQAADKIGCFLLLGADEFAENKQSSAENKLGSKERRFAFYDAYANILFLLKDAEAGILIKMICDFMFGGSNVTEEESKSVSGYFSVMKKSLAKSKKQSENARRMQNKRTIACQEERQVPITLDSIRAEFNLYGNLSRANEICNGVNLTNLRAYIRENPDIRSLSFYKIVEKYRNETMKTESQE